VTAASLEIQHLKFSGHMVAVMALMEAPAIIVGVILIRMFDKNKSQNVFGISDPTFFTNGSVLLILGFNNRYASK
jgi:hypothetical protein